MDRKKVTHVGLVVGALAAAGFFIWRNARAFSSENPDITTRRIAFLCDACSNGFEVSVGESRAYAARNQTEVPCPSCGSVKVQPAFQCPSCLKFFPPVGHGSPPKNCPFCKVAVPRDLE